MLINTQADFLITKLKNKNGLYASSYNIKSLEKTGIDIGTQFAVIRGLTAAYLASKK